MKRYIIRGAILLAVFIAAVIGFGILTSKGNTDMTADMEGATLPRIYFEQGDYKVNYLAGYTEKMDLTAMRDTITTLDESGKLNLCVEDFDNAIESLDYKLFSLDGKIVLKEGSIESPEQTNSLDLSGVLSGSEGVLRTTLRYGEGKEVLYYTRIREQTDLNLRECLDFIKQFHLEALVKEKTGIISSLLESNELGDNSTLQHVTIHCDASQITWGDLVPAVKGDVYWSIQETTSSYTSAQLTYQVVCAGENDEEELYNVKEYFRVRSYRDTMYLLDYDRTMNQVFDGSKKVLVDSGLELGITDPNVEYLVNKDGTVLSFVQERELWNYNQKSGQMSLVFGFQDSESSDIRNSYDQHAVKIISMDTDGSTTFAVYGYMNRGSQEGKVGVAIYYFNIETNSVEEKAFIPSRQSFAIANEELGKLVYYNKSQSCLYVMLEGDFYKINLKDQERELLVKGLKESQYVASSDGQMVAYQESADTSLATNVKVLNLKTGKDYIVSGNPDERIVPLGFINGDFVYGRARLGDAGYTVSGETVMPMYQLEIRENEETVAKTYQAGEVYILDVFVTDSMVTLNRVTRAGDIYTGAAADYITSNEEVKASSIALKSYTSKLKKTVMQFALSEEPEDKSPKVLHPKQVLFENPVTITLERVITDQKYYVYGYGKMQGVYDKAGYAVAKADAVSGVVVNSRQAYVWEKGNRDLQYDIPDFVPAAVNPEESTVAACIRAVITREGREADVMGELAAGKSVIQILDEYTPAGEGLDLTGCTTEDVLYLIGKGTPVIAMTDSSSAVLLTGYSRNTVSYMEPADGSINTIKIAELDAMMENSGHTFIGYVK